jgi:hypothetical protein
LHVNSGHGILSAMRRAVVDFPLVSAAARGDIGEMGRLLADCAPVDTRDRDRRTAVTAAALGDHVAVARVLIDAGADVDLQDAERNNPLDGRRCSRRSSSATAGPRTGRSCRRSRPRAGRR